MLIEVSLFGIAKEVAGTGVLDVALPERATICSLLEHLTGRYGESFRTAILRDSASIWPEIAILLNGANISLGLGLRAELHEGDKVAILPVITGGIILQ